MCEDKWKNKIDEWNSVYGHKKEDILFIKKLRDKGFNDEQICKILETIEDTCDQCWDALMGCHCWNDE